VAEVTAPGYSATEALIDIVLLFAWFTSSMSEQEQDFGIARLCVQILVVILTYSRPLARPKGLPIYVARFPSAPFRLRRELHALVAADFRIFEDFAFVIADDDLFVVVIENVTGLKAP
jgi:hypothetical protein